MTVGGSWSVCKALKETFLVRGVRDFLAKELVGKLEEMGRGCVTGGFRVYVHAWVRYFDMSEKGGG